jgi:hypothetical protein
MAAGREPVDSPMSGKSGPDLTPIPESFREISWEIGESELQKSVMALETFEALRDGQTNVRGIRAKICQKRKLKFNPSNPSTGKWTENPSDRFVNEHAWVLSMMNQFGMIEKVDQRTHQTALLPGGEVQLSTVVDFFRSNEPFEWKPGSYKKAPGW